MEEVRVEWRRCGWSGGGAGGVEEVRVEWRSGVRSDNGLMPLRLGYFLVYLRSVLFWRWKVHVSRRHDHLFMHLNTILCNTVHFPCREYNHLLTQLIFNL